MAAPSWDVHATSEEFLVALCDKAENDNGRLSKLHHGDRVIKLSDSIAVKYGCGVRESEANTQEFANRNADPKIVHVPRVHRFFVYQDPSRGDPRGYLFMEYISGQSLQDVDLNAEKEIIPRIARIIEHLGQIQVRDAGPGPVGGGEPQGYLFGDDGARRTFSSKADFEAWLNIRLVLRDKSINISSHPLVLCHTDLCRRNIILQEDDSISLLDWGHAGMYPRYFEIASLSWLNPYDEPYEKPLIQAALARLKLSAQEQESLDLLQIVRAANLRYSFAPPQKNEDKPDWLRVLHSAPPGPPFAPSQ